MKYNSNFKTKIHETLLIKKHNPGLDRQIFANESLFLLNIRLSQMKCRILKILIIYFT